jgi:hypothetical protein
MLAFSDLRWTSSSPRISSADPTAFQYHQICAENTWSICDQYFSSPLNLHLYSVILAKGPPLWSSGQSSWLQIHSSGFDSRRYQIFWEAVGLERGPPSLVSTTEELLGRKSSGSCLESRDYCPRGPSRWPRCTLYPQKLALTSPTSGGRSAGIVRSLTQATDFSLVRFIRA